MKRRHWNYVLTLAVWAVLATAFVLAYKWDYLLYGVGDKIGWVFDEGSNYCLRCLAMPFAATVLTCVLVEFCYLMGGKDSSSQGLQIHD